MNTDKMNKDGLRAPSQKVSHRGSFIHGAKTMKTSVMLVINRVGFSFNLGIAMRVQDALAGGLLVAKLSFVSRSKQTKLKFKPKVSLNISVPGA